MSSSSSSEPLGCAGRELSVQALLHSQGLQASEDQDPKGDDSELLSSQEDLFDTDKTGGPSIYPPIQTICLCYILPGLTVLLQFKQLLLVEVKTSVVCCLQNNLKASSHNCYQQLR